MKIAPKLILTIIHSLKGSGAKQRVKAIHLLRNMANQKLTEKHGAPKL